MNWLYKLIDWRRLSSTDAVFVGYGPVNAWMSCDPRTWTALHVEANVACVHIEAFTCNSDWDNPNRVIAKLKDLVFWCKRRGLILFVSVSNDNKGKGKYGDDGRKLSAFIPAIASVLKYLSSVAWGNLYVQPVAETCTDAGVDIERLASSLFSKDRLVNNNNGGFPHGRAIWSSNYAVHPGSTEASVSTGAWCVSDHTRLLNEFGGALAPSYDDATVENYAKKMLMHGTPFILYGFKHPKPSGSNIKALGRAIAAVKSASRK